MHSLFLFAQRSERTLKEPMKFLHVISSIGEATTRVLTQPTLRIQHGTRLILCSEVLIHYNLDPTTFSTPAALLIPSYVF